MSFLFSVFHKTKFQLPEFDDEIWNMIFLYLDHESLNSCRLVCSAWKSMADSNLLWSNLAAKRWPAIRPSTRIKNWRTFFGKRFHAEMLNRPLESHPIVNCDFEFQCPLLMENLQTIEGQPNLLYCDQCNRSVSIVSTAEDLEWETALGNCVSFVSPKENPTISDEIENSTEKYVCNIIVVGNPGVGKTTFIRKFHQQLKNKEDINANLTPVGDDRVSFSLVREGKPVDVHFYDPNFPVDQFQPPYQLTFEEWKQKPSNFDISEYSPEYSMFPNMIIEERKTIIDNETARREKVKGLLNVHPKEVGAFLVCFSVTDKVSYHNALRNWAYIRRIGPPDAVVILVGLKTDLRKSGTINNLIHPHVQTNQALAKTRYNLFDKYIECGHDTDMEQVFETIINTSRKPRRLGGCSIA